MGYILYEMIYSILYDTLDDIYNMTLLYNIRYVIDICYMI